MPAALAAAWAASAARAARAEWAEEAEEAASVGLMRYKRRKMIPRASRKKRWDEPEHLLIELKLSPSPESL